MFGKLSLIAPLSNLIAAPIVTLAQPVLFLALLLAPVAPVARFEPVSWAKLPGWGADDALAAWPAIVSSCGVIHARVEWQPFCGAVVAASPGDADFVRAFVERHLTPLRVVRMTGRKRDTRGLVTGYYEPLLRGSRERIDPFTTPPSRPDQVGRSRSR